MSDIKKTTTRFTLPFKELKEIAQQIKDPKTSMLQKTLLTIRYQHILEELKNLSSQQLHPPTSQA
jgi:hypothetical protein